MLKVRDLMLLAPAHPAAEPIVLQSNPTRLGIIQSRGIGDIIIALPIAKWHHDRGAQVFWPIDERFMNSFKPAVDYVQFIPFPFRPSLEGFLTLPERLVRSVPCERVVALYSYLSNIPSTHPALFASLKFDEYKYAVAGVPFAEKWNLSIRRDSKREIGLYDRVVRKDDYIVVHRQGSTVHAEIVVPPRFDGFQVIEINEQTDCVFDWLLVLERAKFLLLIDSCFANLVDQLGFTNEKMFILRSEVRFTPVLRSNWQYYGERNALGALPGAAKVHNEAKPSNS
jgi:hypothetical protein